jgi:uncharacterized protein involved in exopolysaccharide biosynthesis
VDKELTLGQKIKRYRLMNDIRQEDMAESLGVSRATLINYEKGHTTINVDVLDRLNETFSDFDLQNKEDNKPKIIQDNIIDFGVLFSVINKSKKYILSITIILAIIGTGFSFLFSKYYLAQVSLYPAKKDYTQGLGQFQSLASNFGMSVPSSDQDFNIPDVVKSNLIANKVLKEKWLSRSGAKISLIELWELDQSPWYLFSSPNMVDYAFVNEKAIANLLNHVTVTEDRQTGLIKINVTLEDPIIAAQVANYIGEQVQIYIQKGNAAQAAKEKLFISDRLVIVKNELESIELDLKDFKERNRGYDDSPELFMVFSRLFREVEAKKQVYLTLQQQLELSRIEEVKQTPILHILDHAVPPARKSSPNRALFFALSAIFGLFSSSLVTIFKY